MIENDVKIWMNKIGNNNKSLGIRLGGTTFMTATKNIVNLMKGESKGVKLTPIVGDEGNTEFKNNIGLWINQVGDNSLGFTLGKAKNEDATYIASNSQIKKLIEGEVEGVAFNPIIPDEEENQENEKTKNTNDTEEDDEDFNLDEI